MDQARKALYCLYRKLRNILIPIDLQFKLIDTLMLPILTYGSEIWGYENTKQLEKLHLQFCRNILGVRTTTQNFMTYGELGRTPIDILTNITQMTNTFFSRSIRPSSSFYWKLNVIASKLCYHVSLMW
jgi:hypothetical protein